MDSFDRLAGRLVMAAPSGAGLTEEERRILTEGWVGHLILFRRNVREREETRDLIARARSLVPGRCLVAVDQEGGIVSFASAVAGTPPSPMHLAARGDADEVERWASSQASLLRDAGFDMNLAPVLDVLAGPSRVIGTRSFGGSPKRVSDLGAAAVRGYLKGGVLPVGKHFPGHGGVSGDSHDLLPVDRRSSATIRRRDLSPFRAAFRVGLPAVLIAHVAYPSFGGGARRPATLSGELIQGLLRRDLGFRGVVISDDLEMAGFPGVGAVPALFRSGVDLLCVGRSLRRGRRVARALAAALRRGEASAEEARERAERIESLLLPPAASVPPAPPSSGEEWKGIAYAGAGRFTPFPAEGWHAFLPARLGGRLSLPLDLSRIDLRHGHSWRRRHVTLFPFDPSPGAREKVLRKARRFPAVLLGLLGRGGLPGGQKKLLQDLSRSGARLLPAALLDPEPLAGMGLGECLFTFDFRGETLDGLLQVLRGEAPPAGRPPVRTTR